MTHQVHDEVQLDGEVHDEEDAGPWAPGVGRHHHVWKAALQRLTLQLLPCSQATPPSLHSALCALRWGRTSGGRRQPRAGGGGAEPAQGVGPGLLGCGEKNEQVDDAVLQGVEVLQGKGGDAWTTWAATSRAHLSPFPLQTQRASKQGCSIHAGLSFVSCADESRLPTKGVSHVPAVRSPSPFSTRMFQHSKPDPGSFAHKKR